MAATSRVLLSGSLVLFSACGGGTEPSTPPPPPPPPAPPVASVTVAPDSIVVLAGATSQLNAVLRDAQGGAITGTVAWTSTAPGIASVSNSGLVTALQAGHSLVVASSGSKSDSATIYVHPATVGPPVSQTIGTAGGTMVVPVGAGLSLSLTIPAGALASSVDFVLTPKLPAAPGSFLSVTLSPGNVEFLKAVSLSLTFGAALSGGDAQRLALALGTSGTPLSLILPTSSTDGRTFTTTAVLAGAGAAAAGLRSPGSGAAEDEQAQIDAVLATTAQKIAALRAAAQNLEATLQFEAAIRYRLAAAVLLQGVLDDPVAAEAELSASRNAACQKLELYNGTAATRLGSNFRNLWQALRPILSWTSAADGVGVTTANCPERARLNQVLTDLVTGSAESVGFLQLYTAAMQRATFPQNFEGLANELYNALHARQYGSLLGLEAAFADVKAKIQLPLAQRLRAAAYDWCNANHQQSYLGPLFEWARDLGMLPLGLAPVERLRQAIDPEADLGYTAADLSEDIQYCATLVSVLTSSSNGSPLLEEGPLGGQGEPGSVVTGATLAAPPHGTLELDGTLMALYCPNEAYGNDRITVEFNGRQIRELLQIGPTGAFLRNDPVSFSVTELLTQGQVPANGGGSFPFKLIRKGDRCGGSYLPPGDPPDQELLALQLTYPNVTVAPTAVTLDPGQTATFTATLQHSTQGVTWTVTGGSSSVSGNTLIYTAGNNGGTFSVTAKSVADPDRQASATVTINEVCAAVSALRAPGSANACPLPPVQITTSGFTPGRVGVVFDQGMVATGGDPQQPYVWSRTAGSLPPGLSLSTSGRISGTPTTAGTYTFTVKVVNAELEASKQLSILIQPAQVQLMVYEGNRHITIVNTDTPSWLIVYALPTPGSYCFVLNQPTRLPITGGSTCPAGDYGSWTGTITGSTLNATAGAFTKPPTITGTIGESAVSWSGTDPGFGTVYTFSGTRITP